MPPLSLSWTRPCQGCLSTLGRCWCRSRSETIRRHDVQTLDLNLHAFQTSRPYLCLHPFDLCTEVMDAKYTCHVTWQNIFYFNDNAFSAPITQTVHQTHAVVIPDSSKCSIFPCFTCLCRHTFTRHVHTELLFSTNKPVRHLETWWSCSSTQNLFSPKMLDKTVLLFSHLWQNLTLCYVSSALHPLLARQKQFRVNLQCSLFKASNSTVSPQSGKNLICLVKLRDRRSSTPLSN